MSAQILHAGFDGLKLTIQTEITPHMRAQLDNARRSEADLPSRPEMIRRIMRSWMNDNIGD